MSKQPGKAKKGGSKKKEGKYPALLEKLKRELKIEASLEAVRAVALLMKKREDMLQICTVIARQLELLQVKEIRNVQTAIFKEVEGTYMNYEYYAKHDKTFVTETSYTNHEIHRSFAAKMLKGYGEFMVARIKGDKVRDWVNHQKTTNVFIDDYLNSAASLNYYWFSLGPVALGISTYCPLSNKEIHLFKRFLKVFELSYRRYLDIEKAAVQTKEAQIQAALESVRASAMSMHKSEELGDVVIRVVEKFNELDIEMNGGVSLVTFVPGSKDLLHWIWIPEQFTRPFKAYLPYFNNIIYDDCDQARQRNLEVIAKVYSGTEKDDYFRHIFQYSGFKDIAEEVKTWVMEQPYFGFSFVFQKQSGIFLNDYTGKFFSRETNEILIRFSKVFEQAYVRFLDLQKAEAQAREAQIEAALERVRSRTMGMQKSDELKEIIQIVFDQFIYLHIHIEHTGFIMDYKTRGDMNIWLADRHLVPFQITIPYFDSSHWNSFNLAKEKGMDFFANKLDFKEKNKFYQDLFELIPGLPDQAKEYYLTCPGLAISTVLLDNVGLYIENFTGDPYTDEENATLMRFGKVFQQTYTRFNDLQRAEAQARESQIEAALERVRSRTLAMQKSEELAETAAVLFRQLILLGIEPNRLYIGIVKDAVGHIEFWVTDDDGTKVSTQFTGDAARNQSMKKMYDAWKEGQKMLTLDMQGEELQTYFHYLADELNVPFKQGLSQKRRIQSVAFFGKGFLGIASPQDQPEETIQLLERFAAVFNLTYARSSDLQVAEDLSWKAEQDLIEIKASRKKAEETLIELRATQKQLIQSEKMASLGELTAGIAHEIQNPLNFVNNFSEVNKELLIEMNVEIDNGNFSEVKSIAQDISENEEKINHHGRRADAIVKGMLQHSRSTTGAKEPTNINALADEYLKLSYHGLRAKDNSFQATIKTDFDGSIGKVHIIPQDVGRVLLNLFNNAFYAVSEKMKQKIKDYEPTVSVSTKKIENKITITVMDNGNGIPQKIVDKIFQPFFTTKPTGEGTGLGLSLSFDIIQAHGGEIKVNSKEGESCEFVIELPQNT